MFREKSVLAVMALMTAGAAYAHGAFSKTLDLKCELTPQFENTESLSEYDLANEATIRHQVTSGIYVMDVQVEGSQAELSYGLHKFSWTQENVHGYDDTNDTFVELKFSRALRRFEGTVVLDEDFVYRAICTGTQSLIDGKRR